MATVPEFLRWLTCSGQLLNPKNASQCLKKISCFTKMNVGLANILLVACMVLNTQFGLLYIFLIKILRPRTPDRKNGILIGVGGCICLLVMLRLYKPSVRFSKKSTILRCWFRWFRCQE